MARRGRPTVQIELSDERKTLLRWARRHSPSQTLALRCRIVLACADGASNADVAQGFGGAPDDGLEVAAAALTIATATWPPVVSSWTPGGSIRRQPHPPLAGQQAARTVRQLARLHPSADRVRPR
jgi:hypothetical protein